MTFVLGSALIATSLVHLLKNILDLKKVFKNQIMKNSKTRKFQRK